MKRVLMVAVAGAVLLQFHQGAAPSAQTPAPDALTFFKNYFVTGDYVEGGIGLRGAGVSGIATGEIQLTGVPQDADILAAFLYWQVVSTSATGVDSGSAGATFNGYPLSSAEGPIAKVLGQEGTAPCWASGGGTGPSGGNRRTYTYRADVLRFLDIDEQTGKQRVNGAHRVQLPDSGSSGNAVPLALGASLVVLYHDPSKPLNAVVLYDGGFTVDNSTPTMTQTIRGFYQPGGVPDARFTYVVGSGQANKNEHLSFHETLFSNPFGSFDGPSWDSVTASVSLGPDPSSLSAVTTSLDTAGVSGSDCLSVAAVVFKTAVLDTDGDGLLDIWESATTPILDPHGRPLPLLSAMGADKDRKDLFIEVGYMHTDEETSYGGVTRPAHTHLPSHEALKLVGDAFKNAPVTNPNGSTGIAVRFDVGDSYPSGDADEYIIRGPGLARGGEAIHEMDTVCTRAENDPPWFCQFSEYPGTIGWKTGFILARDQVIGPEPPPPAGELDPCDAPGNDGPGEACERRFDRNRKDIFRYALFAHAIGLPKSEDPCLDVDDNPMPGDTATGLCTAPLRMNPDFHTPRTNTGVGDFPGGDAMVTLGAFVDAAGLPVGSPFMQASTLMHEVGHNAGRRHGGEAFEANCKPTYLSVMNYLYQLRGLLDDAGKPHLDFSGAVYPAVDETNLSDISLGLLPYRLGFYAPLAGSYLEAFGTGAARHCDGTAIGPDEVPMVRIDSRTASGVIDWNANGVMDSAYEQDVNFNGRTHTLAGAPQVLGGSNDWAQFLLNQAGVRRNTGALFIADSTGRLALGPMSLDTGRGDLGRGDLGRGDLGRGDLGRGDLGRGDLGRGDLGRGDLGRGDLGRGDLGTLALGRGDLGRGDLGGGDLFVNDPENPGGELDFETATELAKTPPNEFQACVIGQTCASQSAPVNQVRLDWKAPNVGGVTTYHVYRVAGAELQPGEPWVSVGQVNSISGQIVYTLLDDDQLVNGASYTYFAVALYADGVQSDPSNLVTITGVDSQPLMSAIADQSIAVNGTTGPLAFTIADEHPDSVTVAGTSGNTTLVPHANIVLSGSGASRTVTVTPALDQSGTALITLTATDSAGYGSTTSFMLTVQAPFYTFAGFGSPLTAAGTDATSSDSGTFNFGRALPLKWSLQLGGVTVTDLSSLRRLEAVPGTWSPSSSSCTPNGEPVLLVFDNGPTGNSTFRSATSGFTFNWDTAGTEKSRCYRLRVLLSDGSPAKVTTVRFK